MSWIVDGCQIRLFVSNYIVRMPYYICLWGTRPTRTTHLTRTLSLRWLAALDLRMIPPCLFWTPNPSIFSMASRLNDGECSAGTGQPCASQNLGHERFLLSKARRNTPYQPVVVKIIASTEYYTTSRSVYYTPCREINKQTLTIEH